MKRSPCASCSRVKDPENCENKHCSVWRQWFIDRWETLRTCARAPMEQPLEPAGVPLGGRHYSPPHRVRAYLENDPCNSCLCPKDLCQIPCRVKQTWENGKNEVFL